ncbi:MAG: acetoin catabolism protein X, partial [Longimicrobiales bacterium]
MGSAIGIIANPVSARDIRRVIANATSLQITDRANIVLRLLACLRACGVSEVVVMPE